MKGGELEVELEEGVGEEEGVEVLGDGAEAEEGRRGEEGDDPVDEGTG